MHKKQTNALIGLFLYLLPSLGWSISSKSLHHLPPKNVTAEAIAFLARGNYSIIGVRYR